MADEPTLMQQMASLHDAKLADLHLKLDDIQSALERQEIKLERILAFLMVLEHHVVNAKAPGLHAAVPFT